MAVTSGRFEFTACKSGWFRWLLNLNLGALQMVLFFFLSPCFQACNNIIYVHIFPSVLSFLMPHYLPPTHDRHKCWPSHTSTTSSPLQLALPPTSSLSHPPTALLQVHLSFHSPSLSSIWLEQRGEGRMTAWLKAITHHISMSTDWWGLPHTHTHTQTHTESIKTRIT